jgi:O-succinylbenzoate synthase
MDCSLNLTGFEIYQDRLPLQQPFIVLDQPVTFREGLIVRLLTAEGFCGVGEAAPLPGLSEETLKKAIFQLKDLRALLLSTPIPSDIKEYKKTFSKEPWVDYCASVRFAIEMAVLHIMSQVNKQFSAEVLGCPSIVNIPVAGLLQGTPDEIKSQVNELLNQGFNVFKLKIGSRNIPLDVKKVQLVRELIGSTRKLRLDANRAWNMVEAVAFCQNSGMDGIEFIEEPLKNSFQLEQFFRQTGFPVALDESIPKEDPAKFIFSDGVEFIVIKPTIVGGVLKALEWINRALKEKKGVVISSVFESGIASRMLANLAVFSPLAAGLGTQEWLAQDLIGPLGSPIIAKASLRFSWEDIDTHLLTLIP